MARRPTRRSRPKRLEAAPALPRIWAPWRSSYISRARREVQACIFCLTNLKPASLRRQLVLDVTPSVTVMLNKYPYISGHLMIAPRRHVASPELLSAEERGAIA